MTNESMGSDQDPRLLWPDRQTKPDATWLSDEAIRNLGLAAVAQAMCPHRLHREAIEEVLYQLCADTAVITYRQAVLADLLHFPAPTQTLAARNLSTCLEIAQLRRTHRRPLRNWTGAANRTAGTTPRPQPKRDKAKRLEIRD